MEGVWSHGDHVRCVRPGWGMLEGWETVRQSWEAIFRSTGEMRFSLLRVHVHVEGDVGWITCTENILSQADGEVSVTAVLAASIFERQGGERLVVHHHASHVLTAEPPGGV